MNIARLSFMADFLEHTQLEDFSLQAWVAFPEQHQAPGRTLCTLPAGSKACPVGLLPRYVPGEWCWQVVGGEAFPVLKGSVLWTEAPGLVLRGTVEDHVSWYVWRQLAEWLDARNLWLLQFLFSAVYYSKRLQEQPDPRVVAARVRQVAKLISSDDKWETRCPDHPSDILAYLATQGFDSMPA